jgi:ribosome recycling factor
MIKEGLAMEETKEDIIQDVKERMQKSISSLQEDLSSIRAGKANPAIVSKIHVSSYGGTIFLNQMANIFAQDNKTLVIEPWDKSSLKDIEKAIDKANLGINPLNDGRQIRIVFPPLTQDRRNDLAKQLSKFGEEAKVAIRNIRRDGNDRIKKLEKAKKISEDECKRAEQEIQKITDHEVQLIDQEVKRKEQEVKEI